MDRFSGICAPAPAAKLASGRPANADSSHLGTLKPKLLDCRPVRGADPNRKLTRSARATASATIAALLVALVVAACGGGSSSSSTTSTTATHGGTKTGHKTHTPPPLQQLRVVKKGSPPAGTSATAKPGDPVAILVRVPAADATKQLTVAIDRTADTTFTVTSEVAGTPLKATSQITESSGGAEILGVRYACRLQPLTFCPLQVTSSSSTHVKLKIPNPKIPVSLVVQLGAPGSIRAPQLVALGPPAPGSSVSAKVLVTATPKTKGTKPPPLGTSVSITPGSVIRVRVTVAPGAPAHATLPIKIPHTSGHSIT